MHEKYKDKGLVVIGQGVKEPPDADVEGFVKRMSQWMSYRVALDDGATNRLSGKMLENWLFKAEAGVPTVFIIDQKGIIQFIGNPEEVEDQLVEQILAGTFDSKQRARDREAIAAKTETWELHNQQGRAAWLAKKWDNALSEIDQMEKLFPRRRIVTECLRLFVLIRKEDYEAASKLALQLSDEHPDNPFLQHRIARTIASQTRAKFRIDGVDGDLLFEGASENVAIKTGDLIMQRALEMVKRPEPEFLHTKAQLTFLLGKRKEALGLSQQAFELADPGSKAQFADALEQFKGGRLPQ